MIGEALNETEPVRISHYLLFDTLQSAASHHRTLVQLMSNPVQIIFSQSTVLKNWLQNYNTKVEPMTNELPPNLRLETLKTLPTGKIGAKMSCYTIEILRVSILAEFQWCHSSFWRQFMVLRSGVASVASLVCSG